MRLSLHTDFALRTLMFLAAKGGCHPIAEIAATYDISKNHLMKVAQKLAAEGFLVTVPGRGGGVKLASPPTDINVGVVVRTLEDTTAFVECFDPDGKGCIVSSACQLQHALADGVEAFMSHLDAFTVADLIGTPGTFAAALGKT